MFEKVDSQFNLVRLEHRILDWWKDSQAFDKLREKNRGKKPWSFLDGPITANNPMGVHHAWGRTLKDCYNRYHAMLGYELRYQNGFDCQGLWVEVEVEKEMGFQTKANIERHGLEDFVNRCKSRVEKYSKIQTSQSIRLGYWMDWSNSYYTLSDENNYTIWSFLKKCHQRGLIYKGLDAMPWCPRCETGISEQERSEGYKEVTDTAVYIRFPLKGKDNEFLLIWTTTPWTLVANVAVAINPELTYAKVIQDDTVYYLAESLVPIMKEKGKYTINSTLMGQQMIGWEYAAPFDDVKAVQSTFSQTNYAHRIIAWKDVSDKEGVGIVHIAPGCGKEDFDLAQEQGLPIIIPIDESGFFVEGFGFLSGNSALTVNNMILTRLRELGFYYKKENYCHSYPHCWRCGSRLLFRTVEEWYINMDWREEIKEIAKQIHWIPEWGLNKELNWLDNMGDWMISKKRFWGLALPIFECECGWFDVIGSRQELQDRSIDGWENFDGNSPHRPWIDNIRIKCDQCDKPVARILDVGNPWLDAGIVPYSTTRYNTDRTYWKKWIPADLVLECFPGQFRNWFYALLAMSTIMEGIPPFKVLFGHALVKDENGEEMHKSTGNVIWFDEAVEKMGADVMRWIYCGQNPTKNLNFGYALGAHVRRRVINTWWNVYSFFVNYARLDGFDAHSRPVPYEQLQEIDKWLLSKLQILIETANKAFSTYNIPSLIACSEDFIDRLSNWYVRRSRRRFWRPKDPSDVDKLAAYQTLYRVLVDLCKVLAPITPFITEAMFQNLVRSIDRNTPESVHHCDYPKYNGSLCDEKLICEMDQVADVIRRALSIREKERIRVRQPLQKMIIIADLKFKQVFEVHKRHILEELNIKELEFSSDLGNYVSCEVKPNYKSLGPKLGKDIKLLADALLDWPVDDIVDVVSNNKQLQVDISGKTLNLETTDLSVSMNCVGALRMNSDTHPYVILDTDITESLLAEGIARDIVRHIQKMRKEFKLNILDRIIVEYCSESSLIRDSIEEYKKYICDETLSDCVKELPAFDLSNEAKEVCTAGNMLKLILKKAK